MFERKRGIDAPSYATKDTYVHNEIELFLQICFQNISTLILLLIVAKLKDTKSCEIK